MKEIPRTGLAETVPCPLCGRMNQLPPHERVDAPFRCGVCGNTFVLTHHASGWERPPAKAKRHDAGGPVWGSLLVLFLAVLLWVLIAWLPPSSPPENTFPQIADQERQRGRREIAVIEKGEPSLPILRHQLDFLIPRTDQWGEVCYEWQISGTVQNNNDTAVPAYMSVFIWNKKNDLIEAEGWTRTVPAHGTANFVFPDWEGNNNRVRPEDRKLVWLHETPERYTVGTCLREWPFEESEETSPTPD